MRVAADHDWVARFWDTTSGQTRALLEGHSAPLHHLAANREQTLLATSDLQRTIRVWPIPQAGLRSQPQGGKLCCWDTQSGDEVPDFSGL